MRDLWMTKLLSLRFPFPHLITCNWTKSITTASLINAGIKIWQQYSQVGNKQLEYLAVYGRASMGVPVGELQSTEAPTTDCDWTAIGPQTTFFVTDGQQRDYLSRASQRARGATNKLT